MSYTQKFLDIPVTAEQNQLVGIDGLLLVEQASTTTTVMTYRGGQIITITHAAEASGGELSRDEIEDAVRALLLQPWHLPTRVVVPPLAVSGIAIA